MGALESCVSPVVPLSPGLGTARVAHIHTVFRRGKPRLGVWWPAAAG